MTLDRIVGVDRECGSQVSIRALSELSNPGLDVVRLETCEESNELLETRLVPVKRFVDFR